MPLRLDPTLYETLRQQILRRDGWRWGRAEELEVEHIAQGWWRLKRASRHENAMNRVALRTLGSSGRRSREELQPLGCRQALLCVSLLDPLWEHFILWAGVRAAKQWRKHFEFAGARL